MGKMVSGLFGGGKSEMRAAQREQERQRAELDAEKARLNRAEEGRNKLKSSRRGLLAFVDEDPDLAETIGGAGESEVKRGPRALRVMHRTSS